MPPWRRSSSRGTRTMHRPLGPMAPPSSTMEARVPSTSRASSLLNCTNFSWQRDQVNYLCSAVSTAL